MELSAAQLPATGSSFDTNALQSMANDATVSREVKNAEVARQFESILLRQITKTAFEPMFEGALSYGGSGSGVYQYFLTDAIADSLSKAGGIGISNVVQDQLQGMPTPVNDSDKPSLP